MYPSGRIGATNPGMIWGFKEGFSGVFKGGKEARDGRLAGSSEKGWRRGRWYIFKAQVDATSYHCHTLDLITPRGFTLLPSA